VEIGAFLNLFLDRRKEMSLSKLVHLRKLSFVNANAKNETSFDLQITGRIVIWITSRENDILQV
jgi:hypothetical protein